MLPGNTLFLYQQLLTFLGYQFAVAPLEKNLGLITLTYPSRQGSNLQQF